MTEVPKIVYDRLRAARPQGDLPHPDAGLLAAFAERALSASERDGMLKHLALCEDCREVIAMALPDPGIVAVPAADDYEAIRVTVVPQKSQWNWLSSPKFAWPVLRWAALAAGIAVAASILLLHPGRLNQTTVPLANRQVAPPASALPAAGSQTASSAPLSSSMEQTKISPETDEAQPKRELQISKEFKAGRPGQATPTSPLPQSGMLLAGNKKDSRSEDKPQAPASAPPNLDTGKSTPQTVTESVEVAAAGGAVETESSNMMAQNGAPAIEKAKPAPQDAEASQQSTGAAVRSDSLKVQGRNVMSAAKLARSPKQSLSLNVNVNVTWTVAAGVLQRSFDGGQNWQDVLRADHPLLLLCYASHDADIWAGGQAGALYRSGDNGLTWVKVQPSVKAGALNSDITQIEIRDHVRGPAEIVVSTGNSEIWTSPDGGSTWDKK